MLSIGQIDASLRTDQGRVRDHNEDFIDCREPVDTNDQKKNGWLYIVADGVGGAQAGEIASQQAAERTIYHYMTSDNSSNWGERLRNAMHAANGDLRQLVLDTMTGTRMATTMVAVVFHDDLATIANVGDSRAYHWKSGNLVQVTKDHSLVARLVEEGAITPEEAENHPRKNVILQSLGSEKSPQIDLFDVPTAPDEQFVLCSDGLTRHVSDMEIAEAISKQKPADATKNLIALANERGGEDNISVAVLKVVEQPTESPPVPDLLVSIGADTTLPSEPLENRRALLIYTAILCLVQILLIFLVWLSVSG